MHFSMCLQHMEQLKKRKKKIKLIAGVTKYFGGGVALGRWCGTWISATWQRPGPEGSSCFYELGNCRLSLGCASCPEVFKFHIITGLLVKVRRWRGTWQLHGKVGTRKCRDGYRISRWCLGKTSKSLRREKKFIQSPLPPTIAQKLMGWEQVAESLHLPGAQRILKHVPGPAGSRDTHPFSGLHLSMQLLSPVQQGGHYWGCPVQGQELDLKIFVDPFQLVKFFMNFFFLGERRLAEEKGCGNKPWRARRGTETEQRLWPRRCLRSI